MLEGRINLASDTHSRPTQAMRRAMAEAVVGDEQFDLDPTVLELCERAADLLGKDAALFLPSGTMCNVIAELVHCRPGDEIYADRTAHVIRFEGAGAAALAGAQTSPLDGDRGIFSADQLRAVLRGTDRYSPKSRLVVIEQTSNLGGGTIWSQDQIGAVAEVARERGLIMHMDGARLLNAAVASATPAHEIGAPFDSLWLDLSKGLGCPIGAVMAGSQEFIHDAWQWKQRLGGAMRQAGILAAAGLYALDHHIDRLADDHAGARRLGEMLADHPKIRITPPDTNIVLIDLLDSKLKAADVNARLESRGVNLGVFGEQTLRAVTHLDVGPALVEEAGRAILETVGEIAAS